LRRKPSGKRKGLRGPRINKQIRVPEVRLIDEKGENVGTVTIDEALKMTWERGYDLVEVGPSENPPVCKMMDYGKLKYQERKKRSGTKQAGGELKELGLSMKIDGHDLETKMNKARKFLDRGFKVKFNLLLRGREKAFQDTLAVELLDRIVEAMSDVGAVDSRSRGLVGNRLFVIITASKRKGSKQGSGSNAKDKGQNSQGDRQEDSPNEKRQGAEEAGVLAPHVEQEVVPPEAPPG
jgi:translation initiation factor IF-3